LILNPVESAYRRGQPYRVSIEIVSDQVLHSVSHSPPNRPRAVVCLSGGMDSAVCAALAARDSETYALHFSYGQRTERRELESARAVAKMLNFAGFLPLKIDIFRQIGGSALTDASIAVPDAPATEPIGESVPVTYVPFRNAHFLSAAVSWAEVLGAKKVFIGAVEQDSSGYPDCRPAYYEAFQQLIRTGTKEGDITVATPLIHMRKSEIIQLALELSAPLHLTWSCYSGEEEACGVCDSCALRLRAFAQAGVEDPIPYRTRRLVNNDGTSFSKLPEQDSKKSEGEEPNA
jgi:7-cyano-7-deazaguanine synthase